MTVLREEATKSPQEDAATPIRVWSGASGHKQETQVSGPPRPRPRPRANTRGSPREAEPNGTTELAAGGERAPFRPPQLPREAGLYAKVGTR